MIKTMVSILFALTTFSGSALADKGHHHPPSPPSTNPCPTGQSIHCHSIGHAMQCACVKDGSSFSDDEGAVLPNFPVAISYQ